MSYKASNLHFDSHCFFGVEGGVSQGKYASLNTNLNSQDSKSNVERNFAIIADHFGVPKNNMVALCQSISNKAVFLTEPSWMEIAADGCVTTNPQLLLGIKTADCAPVLFADYKNGVIGAAHAGWRGAYRGIVENVVHLMLEHGAELRQISAAIGPCMQKDSFVVKDDMRDVFLKLSDNNRKYFTPKNEREYLFDLSGYIEEKLRKLGIKNIENSLIDTYPPANGYFSYRRYTHMNLISQQYDYPTQYSCIKL